MTNTVNKIIHNSDEYELPEGFTPDNAGTADQELVKTADGYEWKDGVISDDSGVTYHITVSNSNPTSGTASNIITLVP